MNRYKRLFEESIKREYLEGGFYKGQVFKLIKKTNGVGFPKKMTLLGYEPIPPHLIDAPHDSFERSEYPHFVVRDGTKNTKIHASYLLREKYYEPI